jgi:hypothetical protein
MRCACVCVCVCVCVRDVLARLAAPLGPYRYQLIFLLERPHLRSRLRRFWTRAFLEYPSVDVSCRLFVPATPGIATGRPMPVVLPQALLIKRYVHT